MMKKCYAEILLDVPNRRLDQSFHYIIPEGMRVQAGMRAIVPLQQRKVQGLVIGADVQLPPEMMDKKLKFIEGIVSGEPAMPEELVALARWLAETTLCPVAQALHAVWPLLKGKAEEWVRPVGSFQDPDIAALEILDPEGYQVLRVLHKARRGALPLKTLLQRAGCQKSVVDSLQQNGWIEIEMRLGKMTSGSQSAGEAAVKQPDELPDSVFLAEASLPKPLSDPLELTPEQKRAVTELETAIFAETGQTVLLYGVTGSGKTEVYLQLIRKVLQAGGDVILLVPEISLTSQIVDYFSGVFGKAVSVLHSGLSPEAKKQAWLEIINGQKRLVIGARSAVFAPLPNLRLIILDEEHDGAYKQDENPKYHARDVARKRMEACGGTVVLGSATPSLEAYAAAKSGKIQLTAMIRRVSSNGLPPVEIVDMRTELMQGNRSIFSFPLQAKLRERLERGEQSMLLLNRRGYATFVVCRECGYAVRCRNCDVALTYHTQGQAMRCHYCNHTEMPPHRCPQCGSRYIRFFGQGTQRVEEELQELMPEAVILRMDGDTTKSQNAYQEILGKFRRQEASILIGTQMIAKGLDFPNVTLVGVVAADQLLNMPDFRSRERAFQLLTQVAGRAGRSHKSGEVLIQTYTPQDRAILLAAAHDYPAFFREEIGYRRERRYPPFTHIIQVTLLHEKEDRVIRAAQELAACLQTGMAQGESRYTALDVLGPAPAVFTRLKNKYRWQVSVRGKDLNLLRAFLQQGIRNLYQGSASNGVSLNIQVDPLSGV